MLNLRAASARAIFDFFGIPYYFVEKSFQNLNIKTIGDLDIAMKERPYYFKTFVKKYCQDVLLKTRMLEKKYSLKESNTVPYFQNLDMISKESRETSEELTIGDELLLYSLVGQCDRNRFNCVQDLNISQIKKLFYYQDSSSKPLILQAVRIGTKNLQSIINAINLFDEQLIRQNEEDHIEGADLFHLNYEEKKTIVLEEIGSYIDYLEENAENCVWGPNTEAKIKLMREAFISKSVTAIRNKERLINAFTNYMTLSELESGVVKNKTLERFIIN